jgi:hypothetical protein
MNSVVSDGTTIVNSFGLSFSLLMAVLTVVVPRRYAVLPIVILVCYMTMGERVIVAGMNFTMIRILLFFGWLRILVKGEWRGMRWNTIDKLIIAWTVVRTINYTLVWGDSAALVNRLGYAYNIVGAYFLFRFLVRDSEDVYRSVRYLAMFIGPVAILMIAEKLTGHNAFAIFGGVPTVPEVRDGVLRCQGPFAHPILAGTFGATTVPLFVGMWLYRRSSFALAMIASISSTVIVTMSGSSGPALAYGSGILALLLWPIRRKMRFVRWGIVALLVALQVVMNSPVWFVLARLTVFSGSTGWFRGFLIDVTVRHISEWWLIGSNAATQWHPFLADITNQYIAEGLGGGLLAMILFVAVLSFSFRVVGQVVRSRRPERALQYLAWALGAALVTHVVSFISVTYFDQNAIVLYLLLASISTLRAALVSSLLQAPGRHVVVTADASFSFSPLPTR